MTNEISIGYVAIETDTQKPYTGGAYSSGAKVYRTIAYAKAAITLATKYQPKTYEFYEVYYKKPNKSINYSVSPATVDIFNRWAEYDECKSSNTGIDD